MKTPPNINSVRVPEPGILEIAWSTGETLAVDLRDLPSRNPVFARLLEPDFFARLERDEWGHALDWPDGASLGADRLYEIARRQAGLPTVGDFEAWMSRNDLSLSSAAESLGMTRRMIAYYRAGSRPIPKTVWLACIGWESQRKKRSSTRASKAPRSGREQAA